MASFHGRILEYCSDRQGPIPLVMIGTQGEPMQHLVVMQQCGDSNVMCHTVSAL